MPGPVHNGAQRKLYLRSFSRRNSRQVKRACPPGEKMMAALCPMWLHNSCAVAFGDAENGNCGALSGASWTRPFGDGIQIRPQLMPGNASFPFDRQNKFSLHAALGARQPIPDLLLCRADPIRQGLLPSGNIAGALECFTGRHGITLPSFR